MAFYETVLIARQDLAPAQVEALAAKYDGVIASGGGKVVKTEPWGLRTLTYRIKKNRKGYYVLLGLDTPAPALLEMERQMRLDEDVLRHLSVKVEAIEEGPSAILRVRDYRRDDGEPAAEIEE